MKRSFLLITLNLFAVIGICNESLAKRVWTEADRKPAGLAPLPENEPEAIVQVYAARAASWRGYLAVHSWIATKEKNAKTYRAYHVIGWRTQRGEKSVDIREDIPDRYWYGSRPELLTEVRGEKAEKMIPEIHQTALNYNYQDYYTVWPGPNSNTFISHIIRKFPELGVELPPNAIGKDWINNGDFVGYSETGTGVQVSLFGLLGFTVGLGEGVEVNILGMNFGVDVLRPAIKLPFIGRLGFRDDKVF